MDPFSFPFKLSIKEDHDHNIVWVSQLIDHSSRPWKRHNLKANFLEEEVKNIFSTPISLFSQEDNLVSAF